VHGNFILPAFATAMGNATLDIAVGFFVSFIRRGSELY